MIRCRGLRARLAFILCLEVSAILLRELVRCVKGRGKRELFTGARLLLYLFMIKKGGWQVGRIVAECSFTGFINFTFPESMLYVCVEVSGWVGRCNDRSFEILRIRFIRFWWNKNMVVSGCIYDGS